MSTAPLARRLRIAVFGAGSIGCHLGGMLASSAEIALIGRPAAMARIAADGLVLTGPGGARREVRDPGAGADPSAAAGAHYVLVTVKSADTAGAARELAPHLGPDTVVVSFQNGLRNTAVLAAALPGHRVLAGMVPYNVVRTGPGAFHQGSGGTLMLADEEGAGALAEAARRSGLALELRFDMGAVQAAKLLMNLNNAVNALSGLPLREQVGQLAYRRCVALCQREALEAFGAAGVAVAQLGAVAPEVMPQVLELSDERFHELAGAGLQIDATARSSMWEDLQRGRPTEIDSLQGEVLALAGRHGLGAPVNARLMALVREAEAAGGSPGWTGEALLAALAPA
ncbi:2-dehydropantoate 2-reductase [Kitasatospora sp. NPDC052868]|uniref:2-dehydropantoate 2-reductase n=1 Tax=Kitasatospora sp. NPDC052868 TaxID=3364060 RepID=UPI0037C501D0